ncbi:MAG: prolyl oligopeptidase family serine peptidase [Victivallaceae bacterium]|nr:prolyl oligopeptidase family serine peptidase [Victivallaceae bacterium]
MNICITAAIAIALFGAPMAAMADSPAKQVKSKMGKTIDDLGMTPLSFASANGEKLNYRQAVLGSDAPGDYALLLFLHGAGERGDDNISQLINNFPDIMSYCRKSKMKIVVLAPQCPDGMQWVNTPWSAKSHTIPEKPSMPLGMALELVDAKINEYNVDRSRIYITGISMGGYGTWDAVCRRPDFFAGALALCGGADLECAPRLKDMPIRFFHGRNDTIVPVSRSRDMAKALEAAGSKKFEYVELDCGHFAWCIVYRDAKNLEWLFSQKKK